MNRKFAAAAGIAAAASLALAGCTSAEAPAETPEGPVTLTLSGWGLEANPENELAWLAAAFEDENPDVTIELKDYDAAQYDTLLTADLAAGVGPDLITQKNALAVPTYVAGGQLLDVSDIEVPEDAAGTATYDIDGAAYAVPYRTDSWVLYYNQDLFDLAGVDYPDGTWTWDDYEDAAAELSKGLAAAGSAAKGTYQHTWQTIDQTFAAAQDEGDVLGADYDYMKPYYERSLRLQDAGYQIDFNTATANKLHYIPEFGTQKAAMTLMGSWFASTLITQQKSGELDTFNWALAPAPQLDDDTAGLDNVPVTFGSTTGIGINAGIDDAKLVAAKAFLEFVASEEAALILAGHGLAPALINDAVIDAYFATEGAPADDLSAFAWSTHETHPEYPASEKSAAVAAILGDAHSAIMSGSSSIDDALKTAEDRVQSEVGVD